MSYVVYGPEAEPAADEGNHRTYLLRAVRRVLESYGHRVRYVAGRDFPIAGLPEPFPTKKILTCVRDDGPFFQIDTCDMSKPQYCPVARVVGHPLFRGTVKLQYNRRAVVESGYAHRIRPLMYVPKQPFKLHARLAGLRAAAKSRDGMFFRGSLWQHRRETLPLIADVVPGFREKVDWATYCDLMAAHRFAVGLSGFGDFCHRDFEAFAVGTVLVRPAFGNETVDPLVPGVHYVAVPNDLPPVDTAAAILEAYRGVACDDNAYHRIRSSAMGWYDRNVVHGIDHLLEQAVRDWV